MLVLSRRPTEKIVFPSINCCVQVLGFKSGKVRLGIEAPPDLVILREEVLERDRPQQHRSVPPPTGADQTILRELRHFARNRLNTATIGLALLRRQLEAGLIRDSEVTLDRLEHEFQTATHELAGMPKPASPPAAKRRKALLVEDDRNECELLAGYLRLSGFEVDTAADGAAALDYLCARSDQGRPDVMLLDMGLPRCDGATVVRTVRREAAYSDFKIFAVSGHKPEEFGLDTGVNRVDRWFQKPVHPEDLIRELNAELNSSCV